MSALVIVYIYNTHCRLLDLPPLREQPQAWSGEGCPHIYLYLYIVENTAKCGTCVVSLCCILYTLYTSMNIRIYMCTFHSEMGF